EELNRITEKVNEIMAELRKHNITVKFDNRETLKPGFKFAEYELKGVPVRIAIGPRDLENGTVEVARRDTKEKKIVSIDTVVGEIPTLLENIQQNIYQKALKFREAKLTKVDTYVDFKKI